MRRYFVLQGDPTTSGGVVLDGLSNHTFDGRGISYEGASITCPACKAMGVLHCVAPRRPHRLANGKQVALEGDLCLCRCPIPPKVMSTQTAASMGFTGQELDGMAGVLGLATADEIAAIHAQFHDVNNDATQDDEGLYRERVVFIDPLSGKPQQVDYSLIHSKAISAHGSSDQQGSSSVHERTQGGEFTTVAGVKQAWRTYASSAEGIQPVGPDPLDSLQKEEEEEGL